MVPEQQNSLVWESQQPHLNPAQIPVRCLTHQVPFCTNHTHLWEQPAWDTECSDTERSCPNSPRIPEHTFLHATPKHNWKASSGGSRVWGSKPWMTPHCWQTNILPDTPVVIPPWLKPHQLPHPPVFSNLTEI